MIKTIKHIKIPADESVTTTGYLVVIFRYSELRK